MVSYAGIVVLSIGGQGVQLPFYQGGYTLPSFQLSGHEIDSCYGDVWTLQ